MSRLADIILFFLMFFLSAFYQANIIAQNDVVIKLKFEPDHGFYDQEIQVSITPDSQYSVIHYTMDGSVPSITVGQSTQLYQNPITVNKTRVIRAIAIFANGSTSDVMTQTYLFPDDVIQQDYQATLNAGFPSRWGTLSPDYGLDPDIVNDHDYAAHLKEAFLSIPSISIVMDIDDLFGANGIYTNSEETGENWERPASAELIYPDRSEGFQINCGIRIQGGWFRMDSGTKKHSFRLLFKTKYGLSKLRFPLFGEDASDLFDTIVLRAGANDGYAWNEGRYTEQYTRDEFGRRLHKLMGDISAHGMFVHLYLNGIYWGLYNPVERPDDSFSAIYHGGNKNEWDVIKDGELSSGSMNAWNQLLSKCRSGMSSIENYMNIQGKNPDGTRNPDFPVLLDVQNYIDYMIVNMWGGNWDWPWKNYRIARDRTQASQGFQFYIWDYENTMGNNRERSPLTMDRVAGLTSMGVGVGELHINLVNNENYRLLFADHIQKYFFNGGHFSPESLIDNYTKLASEVELAIIPESARWGDQHFTTDPLTQDDWYVERDWILNTYLPQRSDIVLNQFRKANLYPQIDAPVFQVNNVVQHGGVVTTADQISITAAEGIVYYTLDGSDPRLMSNSTSNNFIIVPEDIQKYVMVPQSAISSTWRSAPGFDVTNWLICTGKPGGVGYERDAGYDDYISLDVEDEMYSKNATCYIRIPFNVSAEVVDSLFSCTLRIRYDDGFIAYLNGTEVARKNFTGNPQWNSNASSQNSDASAVVFEDFDISQFISRLNAGLNILAIQGMNAGITSSDFLTSAELTGRKNNSNLTPASVSPSAFKYSEPLTLNQTVQIKSRVYSNGQWSALNEAVFTIPLSLNNIIISELHYHPLPQDSVDESKFEFIELQNVGTETQSLGLDHFAEGINFLFPVNTILHPGEYLVLASDAHYFNLRYGFSSFGVYSGQLDNGGEQIVLLDASGDTLISFRYNDKQPWPESADGEGYSLVFANPGLNPDYNNPANWRASKKINGNPGGNDLSVQPGKDRSLPEKFFLLQNYPNPFNSRTNISFEVSQKALVSITVFNVLGQEIKTLVNQEFITGRYIFNWEAGNFSNGVYFIFMKTNQYQHVIKVALIK